MTISEVSVAVPSFHGLNKAGLCDVKVGRKSEAEHSSGVVALLIPVEFGVFECFEEQLS